MNSHETSTETVVPKVGIDAKYLVPSPNLNQSNDYYDDRPKLPPVDPQYTIGMSNFEFTISPLDGACL